MGNEFNFKTFMKYLRAMSIKTAVVATNMYLQAKAKLVQHNVASSKSKVGMNSTGIETVARMFKTISAMVYLNYVDNVPLRNVRNGLQGVSDFRLMYMNLGNISSNHFELMDRPHPNKSPIVLTGVFGRYANRMYNESYNRRKELERRECTICKRGDVILHPLRDSSHVTLYADKYLCDRCLDGNIMEHYVLMPAEALGKFGTNEMHKRLGYLNATHREDLVAWRFGLKENTPDVTSESHDLDALYDSGGPKIPFMIRDLIMSQDGDINISNQDGRIVAGNAIVSIADISKKELELVFEENETMFYEDIYG